MVRIIGGLMVACCLVGCGFAQESGSSESTVPEINAPEKPAPGQESGMMSGNKPFTLVTDPGGELNYNFNEDNEVESLVAKRGVVFTNEDMTLKCDKLDYKAMTGELVARGKKVIVRLGEVIATCKLFKYFPNDQRGELTGSPMLYSKTRDGKVSNTTGEKIVIATVNGKPQIKVIGGTKAPTLSSGGATAPAANNSARITSMQAPEPGGRPETQPGMTGQSGQPTTGSESMDEESGATPRTKRPNKIDVNNPGEMQSYSEKKQ